jgi:hypothetical protein
VRSLKNKGKREKERERERQNLPRVWTKDTIGLKVLMTTKGKNYLVFFFFLVG